MVVDTKKSVLVVDDYPSMRHLIKSILHQLGFAHVMEADDGDTAVRLLEDNHRIDLIISDWNMPKMSGLERWWAA